MKIKTVAWLILGGAIWLLPCLSALSSPSPKYDIYFKTSFAKWMPGHNWHWLKAQCWQESRFKRFAVSPVGASGICQFMPGTWTEAQDKLNTNYSVFNIRANIEAAAWYDRKMYHFWTAERPQLDKYKFMLAGYNAGPGNMLKAQKKCNGANGYYQVICCLPAITGHHATETINYVERIIGFKADLEF